MGIQLAHGGYDFTIFDRGDDFGGTWRKNTYPGAACDVPSHFYSYSFALNPRWSKTFADQPEILAYIEKVVADHGLAEHLIPRTRITTLRWSDTDQRWTLTSEDGQSREFDIVVSAVGMLDVPNIPDIPGANRFRGRAFHSSNWDHSKSTAGERVASIGTGASAVQYVPAIAADTAHLTVFQRTPIWVSPRYDEPFTPEQQELFERDPAEALKVRDAAYQDYESANFAVDSDDDQRADRHGAQLSASQSQGSGAACQADPVLPGRMQATTAIAHLVPDIRVTQRDAGDLAHRRVHRTRPAHG